MEGVMDTDIFIAIVPGRSSYQANPKRVDACILHAGQLVTDVKMANRNTTGCVDARDIN